MKKTVSKNVKNFSKITEILEMPYMLDLQVASWIDFLQMDVDPKKRKYQGLEEVFRDVFPIEDYNRKMIMEYLYYEISPPEYDEYDCLDRGISYEIKINIHIRVIVLKEDGSPKMVVHQDSYLGDLPCMTSKGTFVVNGSERAIVSQFQRSPGIFFDFDDKKNTYCGKIIPNHGAWLQFEIDQKDILYIKINKRKKLEATLFLKVFRWDTNEKIIESFYKSKTVEVSKENLLDEYIFNDIKVLKEVESQNTDETVDSSVSENGNKTDETVDSTASDDGNKTGEIIDNFINEAEPVYEVLIPAGKKIGLEDYDIICNQGVSEIKIIDRDDKNFNLVILNTLAKENFKNADDALRLVYENMRPNNPFTPVGARDDINNNFFNNKKYDFSKVGRYKINNKFNEDLSIDDNKVLREEDIFNTVDYLINFRLGNCDRDDIDNLGNRRIRLVGELIQNQFKIGLAKMERQIKEKMNMMDMTDVITPTNLLNIKPLSSAIREFFCSSPLSQFLEQTNPLAEITHKRRLSALGPGGLTRDRAGFEVRDVHPSHYGRVCPIETPEGPNIGLIVSLSTFARVNELGFIETPYQRVENGVVTDKIDYLNAFDEYDKKVAQANAEVDENGKLIKDLVSVRWKGDFDTVRKKDVDYKDVSPKQLVSYATSLIPFLENDDANRALMGSNMQRQSVPLLWPEAPVVKTGMEKKVAVDSGLAVIAKNSGRVVKVEGNAIWIDNSFGPEDDFSHLYKKTKKSSIKKEKNIDKYKLLKYRRTNQFTCLNQKPLVYFGDYVEKGQVIADGPSMQNSQLALGRNVLVAFMSWEGFNFEDAIIISDKLVREDVFTSVHIERFEVSARDTKLGEETITKDIFNVSPEILAKLDDEGIIKVGTRVKTGDILVGKVTPKSTSETSPEQKLLQSIFGEKAGDVKDTSLKLKHGSEGIVIGVDVFSREKKNPLPPGVKKQVRVYIATKRKVKAGDKMAGRHGNKGVISCVVPEEDMPFLEDGTPIDIILNPLGVPSRMNIGQILETHLGWAGEKLNFEYVTPVFDGASEYDVSDELKQAGLPENGKLVLYNGKDGSQFKQSVAVGLIYMMKLNHLADEKIHARSTGPYSLVTQQPLGGKAQFGGQRLGEMEVWAIEAYGAAYSLQEFLTVKSDDVAGRTRMYEAIVKGDHTLEPGLPESFNVLIKELQGLSIDVELLEKD